MRDRSCLSLYPWKGVWSPHVGAAQGKRWAVRQMGGKKAKWRTIFTDPLVWARILLPAMNEPTAVGLFVALSSLARVTISPMHETIRWSLPRWTYWPCCFVRYWWYIWLRPLKTTSHSSTMGRWCIRCLLCICCSSYTSRWVCYSCSNWSFPWPTALIGNWRSCAFSRL